MKALKILFCMLVSLIMITSNAWALKYTYDLTNYPYTASVKYDESYKWYTNIEIPNEVQYKNYTCVVTGIDKGAFNGMSNIKSVSFPSSLERIDENAFKNCTGLTSITFPQSIQYIGPSSFWRCTNLTNITIPSSVTTISDQAFEGCVSLETVSFSNETTESPVQENNEFRAITYCAFRGCKSLKEFVIPNGINSVGTAVFEGCMSLESVTIPSSVYEFHGGIPVSDEIGQPLNKNLKIYIPSLEYWFGCKHGGVVQGTNGVYDLIIDGQPIRDLVIPDTIKYLLSGEFNNLNIESVTLPNYSHIFTHPSLTDKGWIDVNSYGVFKYCKNLKQVYLPDAIEGLGESTFMGCSSLETVKLPSRLESLFSGVFSGCSSLSSIVLPSKLKKIEHNAFYGCTSLSEVYLDYDDINIWCQLYKEGSKNNPFERSDAEYTGGVFVSPYNLYLNGQLLTDVTIGTDNWIETRDTIKPRTFQGCKSIQRVVLKNSVLSYGRFTFKDCISLESISLSKNASLDASLFEGCSNLKIIEIPEGVTTINRNAIYNCTDLNIVSIPSTVNDVKQNFGGCDKLEKVIVRTANVPTTIDYNPNSNAVLYVPKRAITSYQTADMWKEFPNIKPLYEILPSSVERLYGDSNPTFDFTTDDTNMQGTPVLTCKAVESSPVGEYQIIVSRGSLIEDYYDYSYSGTLTITKAPLIASVGNYSREQGLENPAFVVNYEGWKLGETESELITAPTATTSATKESPIGDYPITLSGGEAQNYDFEYINGTLTVIEASGIDNILSLGRAFDIYTTTGTKIKSHATTLDGLSKGVYIVNKKKVLVK